MDVSIATTHLNAWLAADIACAAGQSYSIGSRTVTRADAVTIRQQIAYWQNVIESLTAQAAGQTSPGVRLATWS